MEFFSNTLAQLFQTLQTVGQVLSYTWFIIFPPVFLYLFKIFWMYYIQTKYWLSLDWVLLEIIPPKNIEKSPKPMEALFIGMAGTEATLNPKDIYIDGKFADSFSLEFVSDGGEMHIYIRCLRRYRHLVEAHLYAQYPDIELNEVPDYVNEIPKIVPNMHWELWGTDLEFVKHNAYPLRTYKHFEEDITGKMIDPFSSLAETMSKLPPGQKIWFQMVISPLPPSWAKNFGREAVDKLKGKETAKASVWENIWKDFKDVITNIIPAFASLVEFEAVKKKEDQPLDLRLTPVEREIFKEVEEKLGKIMYQTKIRFLYLGKKDGFDKAFVSSFMGGIKQFNDDNLNGLKPQDASKTYANYVLNKTRLRYRQRKILRRYRNRSRDGVNVVLNTEELATLFHIPDMQVVAPSLARTEAKRGGAPTNLPVE